MISVKSGVRIEGMRAELLFGIVVANQIYNSFGYELTITACTDGDHMSNSRHHIGQAADLRTRHMEEPKGPQAVARKLRKHLGKEYDIVVHKSHIHMEFDPRKG